YAICFYQSAVCPFVFQDSPLFYIHYLSLHDALPILRNRRGNQRNPSHADRARAVQRNPLTTGGAQDPSWLRTQTTAGSNAPARRDRKSTRLNSSHVKISYAVFCLKKK